MRFGRIGVEARLGRLDEREHVRFRRERAGRRRRMHLFINGTGSWRDCNVGGWGWEEGVWGRVRD